MVGGLGFLRFWGLNGWKGIRIRKGYFGVSTIINSRMLVKIIKLRARINELFRRIEYYRFLGVVSLIQITLLMRYYPAIDGVL